MRPFSRRNFMRLLVATGLGNGFSSYTSGAIADSPEGALSPLSNRLNGLLAAKESARVVGRRYLQLFPHEADTHRLTQLICRSERRYERLARVDTSALHDILARQQRLDFRNRRIVTIDGWTLSETEARLCAISALV